MSGGGTAGGDPIDLSQLPRLVRETWSALEEAGLQPVLGGALAGNYYRDPRETIEIDINVHEDGSVHSALSVLADRLGAKVLPAHVEAAVAGAQAIGIELSGGVDLDIFFAFTSEFADYIVATAREVIFDRQPLRILSPECLVMMKAAFDRIQDWADIEAIVSSTPVDLGALTAVSELIMGLDEELNRIREMVKVARLRNPDLRPPGDDTFSSADSDDWE